MNVRQALSSENDFWAPDEEAPFASSSILRNRFVRIELDERSSIILDISKLPHFQNIYLIIKWIKKAEPESWIVL